MNKTPDYLIIGQGLAGSMLAWELIQRQKQVIVVDNGQENASKVAAGLINPVTGMRFVKSSDVDLLLPCAKNYYQQLSLVFKENFFIEKTMLRLLRNEKELQACQKRLKQAEYQHYLEGIIPSSSALESSNGLLQQTQTGYLLTQPLLDYLKNYFISKNSYINTQINYDDIELFPSLRWQNFQPKKIIFCEGYLASTNPWFSYLPFQPVKGEIITASATKVIQQNILNYGHWFIPLDEHRFRTGATFDRINLNQQITTTAKETLFSSLKQIMPNLDINKTINQQAGIRPCTLDKQPFIGQHPQHSNLLMFNGFGAKGSLQIPFYCQSFADSLLSDSSIPPTSNILRYNSLHTN